MKKDEYVRVLEKNQEAILAHVLKIECEMKDLRVFVRELLHAVDRLERQSGKEAIGEYTPYSPAPENSKVDRNTDLTTR